MARCPMFPHVSGHHTGTMDLMTQAPGLTLFILALIDATSIGTLIIPIWLLLRSEYRRAIPRVIAYLAILAFFYAVVGLLLRSGWDLGAALIPEGFFQQPALRLLGLVLGAGMIIWALTYKTDAQKEAALAKTGAKTGAAADTGVPRTQADPTTTVQPDVPKNLRGLLAGALDTKFGVLVLALVAGVLELPTMLPYLGAMTVLKNSGWAEPTQLIALGLYCLVMILPALLLVGVRALAGERLDGWLQRVGVKLGRYAQETLGWVVGIAGYLLIRSALSGTDLQSLFERAFNS